MTTKVEMTDVATWMRRNYKSTGAYQWARELLQNAIEADASRVEFGIEWQSHRALGVYRMCVVDDGVGMDQTELWNFFTRIGASGKQSGGVHDNFGIGAKVTCLPWNPDGVVVISRKGGKSAMIRIYFDYEVDSYVLEQFDLEDGPGGNLNTVEVVDPDEVSWSQDEPDWSKVLPEWTTDHGTAVVLLGDASAGRENTILGDGEAGENGTKGLTKYLNTRFWNIPSTLKVTVNELRSPNPSEWPTSPKDRADSRRPNGRTVRGAHHFVEFGKEAFRKKATAPDSKPKDQVCDKGEMLVADGKVRIAWFLWRGTETPEVHQVAERYGYTALRYKGELFDVQGRGGRFKTFGVVPGTVQDRLTLIIEPQLFRETNGRWGVHPDDFRQHLRFTSGSRKSIPLPLSEWGAEFQEEMPELIRSAISDAVANSAESEDSIKYREALAQKFGDRWKRPVLIESDSKRGRSGDPDGEGDGRPKRGGTRKPRKPPAPSPGDDPEPRPRPTRKRRTLRAKPDGSATGKLASIAADIPKFVWLDDKLGSETSWALASWSRSGPDGPTVYLTTHSPLYTDLVGTFQAQYADVHSAAIAEIVKSSLGQIVVCKVAHACALSSQGISEQEIDDSVLTDEALTVSLMGIIAEEAFIATRLGQLGAKKKQPPKPDAQD